MFIKKSNIEYLSRYYFKAIGPNLWGAPHMSSFGFMALCFPVSAKGCVCPLDGQPRASKPLSVQATATILSKLHHLSRSQQCNRCSAAAGFASHLVFAFLYFFSTSQIFSPLFSTWNRFLLRSWNLKLLTLSYFIVFLVSRVQPAANTIFSI